jgi:hypothetical protein
VAAVAVASAVGTRTAGVVREQAISFSNLLPATPYDVQIALADGTELRPIDLSWYNEEPAKADAGPLDDTDRHDINMIVTDVPSFYNKGELLLLKGDHDRAVGLVQMVRDTPFYASKGDIVWRIELWYFKNQYGGWEIISQQNKIIRRERFKNASDYAAALKVKWVPELGGIRLPDGAKQETLTVQLPPSPQPAPPSPASQP